MNYTATPEALLANGQIAELENAKVFSYFGMDPSPNVFLQMIHVLSLIAKMADTKKGRFLCISHAHTTPGQF